MQMRRSMKSHLFIIYEINALINTHRAAMESTLSVQRLSVAELDFYPWVGQGYFRGSTDYDN